nr:MAG TPA: hypothetical protein [Caudoviricetes sp.]
MGHKALYTLRSVPFTSTTADFYKDCSISK